MKKESLTISLDHKTIEWLAAYGCGDHSAGVFKAVLTVQYFREIETEMPRKDRPTLSEVFEMIRGFKATPPKVLERMLERGTDDA